MKLFRNPRPLTDLWDGREIGDPYMMRFDGRTYLYCSSHGSVGIKCWISDDMINFEYYGSVCDDPIVSGAYAPEVIYNAGKFIMVTSPRGSGHYVLVSEKPTGPFVPVSPNLGIGIDGSLFVDDDGKSYFYRSSHQGIRVHKMPSPTEIDPRSTPIEASYLNHWTEGPMVIKRDGRYFLTDTGNHVLSKGYHIDYCVSHEGPDRGYRALRDKVLLIETRDEFHALGHSSTCVGPDMDTMYIVYHKNILNEWNRPTHRSLNLDRLFFNGDRMYTNATWWYQPAPTLPTCSARGIFEMEACPFGMALPMETESDYTAEINFLIGEKGGAFFSADENDRAVFTVSKNREWTLSSKSLNEKGTLPECVCTDALMTLKVSLKGGKLSLFMNNLEIFSGKTTLGAGKIGVCELATPSFVGFSNVCKGNRDGEFPKSVPGVFDAVHALDPAEKTAEGETGTSARVFGAGEIVSFPVNVWKSQAYYLSVTLKSTEDPVTFCVNGSLYTAEPVGCADADGFEKRFVGKIALGEGIQKLDISTSVEAVIDRIYLTECDCPDLTCKFIENGEDVSENRLCVVGHKARNSMHKKFCGYTAAEGYGEAWLGGEMRDYELRMTINMMPCTPEARVSAYIRARRESWHPHQVGAGRFAYALTVTENKITLSRQAYAETVLAEAPLSVPWGEKLSLTLRAQGSRITVLRENEVLLSFNDPMQYVTGKVGISAHTDGMGFECVELVSLVKPAEAENDRANEILSELSKVLKAL